MPTIKERLAEVINNQPMDATYDKIIKELAFERMVLRGLEDSRQQRTISNEELERRIRSWQQ